MIRHVALFLFGDDVDEDQVEELRTALRTMPEVIPFIRRYDVGVDLGLANNPADLAVVADFDSVADYQAYASNPDHMAVVRDRVRPIVSSVTRL